MKQKPIRIITIAGCGVLAAGACLLLAIQLVATLTPLAIAGPSGPPSRSLPNHLAVEAVEQAARHRAGTGRP